MASQHNFQQSHGFRAPLGDGGMRQNQGRGGYKGNFYNRPVSVRPSVGTHPMFPPEGQHRQYFNPNRPFFSPPRVPHQNFGEFRPPRHPRITHGNMNNRFNMQGKNTSYDRQWKGQKHNFQKGDSKFDAKKYFKESMLEDPWKELISQRNMKEKLEVAK